MTPLIRLLLFVLLFAPVPSRAQHHAYDISNGHAHNDYLQKQPFYEAYDFGFGSIEADVYPVKGVLHVAHHKNEIREGFTLSSYYIEPLARQLEQKQNRKLLLLIDIKEDYKQSLELLIKELIPLKNYLHSPTSRGPVMIAISGDRPAPAEFDLYPDYIWFDSDLKYEYSKEQWGRVALVSLPFNKWSDWKAESDPKPGQLDKVQALIDSVHRLGKPIRFWAAPDNKLSWQWQQKLKVDLIGTDKLEDLALFLRKEDD